MLDILSLYCIELSINWKWIANNCILFLFTFYRVFQLFVIGFCWSKVVVSSCFWRVLFPEDLGIHHSFFYGFQSPENYPHLCWIAMPPEVQLFYLLFSVILWASWSDCMLHTKLICEQQGTWIGLVTLLRSLGL